VDPTMADVQVLFRLVLPSPEMIIGKTLEDAVKRKILIKVNTVLIPTVNNKRIVEVATAITKMVFYTHNIIPHIPQYKFANIQTTDTIGEDSYKCRLMFKHTACIAVLMSLVGREKIFKTAYN
jgi:hypothetical protein